MTVAVAGWMLGLSCGAGWGLAAEPVAQTVREAALQLMKSPEEMVRLSAIRVLGRIGTAEDVPLLVGIGASAASEAEKAESLLAVCGMRGREIDRQLLGLLGSAGAPERAVVIRSLADRRPREALDAVLAQAGDSDATVRQEALKALQPLADEKSIPALVRLLAKASDGADRDALELAIVAACRRNPDSAKKASPLVAMLAEGDDRLRVRLLPIIGQLGGKEAIDAITAARQDASEQVREAAIRGLCNWPESDVAADLLALAKQPPKPEHRAWAVRALARVIPRAAGENPDQRAAMLQETLALAEQPADKNFVLSRLSAVRSPVALTTALSSTDDAALRDEAIKAVIELSRAMWTTHEPVAREALEKIKPLTADPELKATIDRIIENPDTIRKGSST